MKPRIEPLRILEGKEKTKIKKTLKEQFGIKEIPGMILKRGKERIFLYQGSLSNNEIKNLEKATFVERVGVYLAKDEPNGIRLSIEGSQILKDQITKNVVELTKKEVETWMMGYEVLKKSGLKGVVIIKYKNDMLGSGKASEEKITNFIPKSRRLKDRNIE